VKSRYGLFCALAITAILSWNWYQNRSLWKAARIHYVESLRANDQRLAEIFQACELENIKEEIGSLGSHWVSEPMGLVRGRPLDPDVVSLKFSREYQFYTVLYKMSGDIIDVVCEYDHDFDNAWVYSGLSNEFYDPY
jgi:hypothetical protein